MNKKNTPRLWLKHIRESKGYSYTKAVEVSNVTVGVYYKVETGFTHSPRVETARKISEGLGFNVERFFEGEDKDEED